MSRAFRYFTMGFALVLCVLMLIPDIFIATSPRSYFVHIYRSLGSLNFLFSPPTGWIVFFGFCLLLVKRRAARIFGAICVYLGAVISIFAFLAPVL